MASRRVKCPQCGGPMVPHATRCGACYWSEMQRMSHLRLSRLSGAREIEVRHAPRQAKPPTSSRVGGDGFSLRPVYKIDVLNLKVVREIGEGAEEARPHLGGHLRKPPPFEWAWRDREPERTLA